MKLEIFKDGPFEGEEEYNKSRDKIQKSGVAEYETAYNSSIKLVEKYIASEIIKINSKFADVDTAVNLKINDYEIADINRMKSNDAIAGFLEEAVNACINDKSIEYAVQAKKFIIKVMGYRIRTIRFVYGIPLKKLASIMDISVSLLDKIEKGKNLNVMQYNYYYRLYFVFYVSIDYLLGLSHLMNYNKYGGQYIAAITHSFYHAPTIWGQEIYKDIYISLDAIYNHDHGKEDIDEIRNCLDNILNRLAFK